MVTKAPKLKEYTLKDIDTYIHKALKIQDPKLKYEALITCLMMMKTFLKIDDDTVIP